MAESLVCAYDTNRIGHRQGGGKLTLSEILTGNLTLSGAYWFKTDSGPLTSLHCTLVTGIKCSKLLYIVEKSAGQSPF